MGVTLQQDTHANRLVEQLQQHWTHTAGHYTGSGPLQRIAGSAQDQQSPAGHRNPLWDIVRWMPAGPRRGGDGPLEPATTAWSIGFEDSSDRPYRNALCSRYSWSIVSPGDIAWIVGQLGGRSVVEIGAGTGYWAWQLEQAGVDVAAYDPNPVAADNEYCKYGPYTTVHKGGVEAVLAHQDRALLMVWPPYGGAHAEEALRAYTGNLLIYAGEGYSGCTADDGFYDLLDAEWAEVSVAPQHVTWSGIHCGLSAFRRSTGLEG